ncbi:hypothetical protein B0I72DRAFT_132795 [Yarrowia lipolytica]|jgi:hypothetical protein|uniref:YALI0F25465p n=2 Tax=Yarrowia lipolytica TaxID=4952 RepID=Q6C0E4_YARLI|nr:YALI0F25465p [Yarrowia lipolytica CLIB122]AOW07690.1 hypothetical protein YALI1_F32716g [Yarrowia lipolytica]KAB8284498.1 hypothetical protein BKA91DRAFT_134908 [Yarrowia lipolytica]KAE8174461.1 hypothetical protein BKA90DRAFT_134002 [Yarrowia lipolytica]KAJ8055250.1 hypothetical protein LXG23DRAFT_34912 [Yarrowia lipolytica]QNP99416.1 Hypothetical protein YALI2_E00732g [Yarrowia lipolytica]|eukprot:XP_505868.1 YALI0F25465p [Yarrowia lipolytica CLIB122]
MNRDEAIQATLDALNQPMVRGDSSDYLNSRPSFHSRRSSIMAQLSTPNHHARTPSVSMSDSDLSCMDENKRRSRISIDFSGLYSPASSTGDWCEKELLSPDPEIESLDKKRSSKGSEFFKRWSLGPATSVTQVSRQTQALLSPQEFHTAEFEPQSCMWQRTLQEMARTDNTRLALLARNSNANSYPLQSMHNRKRHSCDFTSSTTASNGLGLGLGPLRASTPVKGPNNPFVPFSFETGSEESTESPVHTKLKHRTSMSRTRPLSMTRSTSQKFNSGNFSLRQRAGTPTPTRDGDSTQVDSFVFGAGDMSSDSNSTAVDPLDTQHTQEVLSKPPLDPTIPITDWSQKAQLVKLICASIQDAPTMMAYINLLWTALSNPENLNLNKIDIVPSSLEDVAALQDNLVLFVSEIDVKAMVSAGWIRFYKVMYASAVVSATIGLLAFQTLLLLLYLCVASVIILGSNILHKFEKKTQPQEAAKVLAKECKEE